MKGSRRWAHLVVGKLVLGEPKANLGSGSVKRVRGVDQVTAIPLATHPPLMIAGLLLASMACIAAAP